MRALHVITGLSLTSGGPARSVQGLVAGLNAAGVETWLMTLSHGDEPWVSGVTRFENGEDFEEVVQRVEPDIVHLHGIWSLALHRCVVICRRWHIPYVVAPRGMLEPWSLKQKWLKKRLARWLYQDRDLKCAAALHATAGSEAEQFRKLGFKNPIIVSPNGVNVPGVVRSGQLLENGKREDYLRRAQEKVDEWLNGLSTEGFAAALDELLDRKLAEAEYRFKGVGGREAMREGAVRFFIGFSRRIVQLSDGRCVYFTPDERAKERNADNAVSWAEYAVHAVTSSGKILEGKEYRERLYNPRKVSALQVLESVIRNEHCMYRLIDAHPENDAVVFVGSDAECARLEVVTRLDSFGNADANLAEVTVVSMHKRKHGNNVNPPSKHYRPLTEVVETVAKHQAAGFSPSTTVRSIAYSFRERKGARRILFVSRMHPKKGVMELVEAWKLVVSGQRLVASEQGWCCELVYTVSGELERKYEEKVKQRVRELGLEDQFIFTGALNDDEKWKAYARADLFVLPTYSENFGIVVAEALWAGVPVITTKGTPWRELGERKCGWWIETGAEPLAEALKKAMALSDVERAEMGERGRKLVEEKYTWDAVVKAMVEGYESVVWGRILLTQRSRAAEC